MAFVQAHQSQFQLDRKGIHFRGLGLGSWLNMEHFMVGIPTPDQMIQRAINQIGQGAIGYKAMQRFREAFFNEADMGFIASCGINLLRVPMNHRLFIDETYGRMKEEGFYELDRLMDMAKRHKVYILLDMHTSPGGQNPDWHSDNRDGRSQFFEHAVFRNLLVRMWQRIAKRYSHEEFLLGYDLLNEPAFGDWRVLNLFYKQCVNGIREVDKNHLIVLEGNNFSMEFDRLELPDDPNIALGFHYYPTVWKLDLLEVTNRSERVKAIREGFEKIKAECEAFGCPLLCGEFGYGKDCGGMSLRMELTEDTVALFEEQKISWAMWSYKDVGFMGLVYPSSRTLWHQLTEEISKKWSQDIEKMQALTMIDMLRDRWFPNLSHREAYRLQFRMRSILYECQYEHILKPHFAKYSTDDMDNLMGSFAFEECEKSLELIKWIKTMT